MTTRRVEVHTPHGIVEYSKGHCINAQSLSGSLYIYDAQDRIIGIHPKEAYALAWLVIDEEEPKS